MAFQHVVRHMSLDSWVLGCPGSGNILFQWRMSSIFWTNGILERRPWVTTTVVIPILPQPTSVHSVCGLTYLAFFFPLLKPPWQSRVTGFAGGGSNTSIGSALPPSFCVLYWKHQIVYWISIYYFLCLPEALVSGCGDNHGPWRPVPSVCRLHYCNVLGLAGNLSNLTEASSRYDILLCSETLVSDMHHVS